MIIAHINEKKKTLKITPKGTIIQNFMEIRFIDTLAFMGVSLDKAIKNLLNINSGYCYKCKKQRELKNPILRVASKSNIIAYDDCEYCNTKIEKICDYTSFKYFNERYKNYSLEGKAFLLQKGVYPYEWVDDYKKFDALN